jgi:hypothetical protein
MKQLGRLMSRSVQLARQEGREFRSVHLSITASGVTLKAQDVGPTAEQAWGRDGEYEFSVEVMIEMFPALLFALLKERYDGKLDAVDLFHKFCERNGITCEFSSWP